MANDGIKNRYIDFGKDKIEFFEEFSVWDTLPQAEGDKKYEEFIQHLGAGRACQALHEYQVWKRQLKGGKR